MSQHFPLTKQKLINQFVSDSPYSVAEEMPEAVLGEMTRIVYIRKADEAYNHRIMALRSFREAQPQIERLLSNIYNQKASITPREYLKKLYEISCNFSEIGSIRNAWIVLLHDFEQTYSSLQKDEQLGIGIWLSTKLNEDKRYKDSIMILRIIEPLLDTSPDAEKWKIILIKLKLHALIYLGTYKEAQEAILEAKRISAPIDEYEAIEYELNFLHGNIGAIP